MKINGGTYMDYYQLKYLVTESFYDFILSEHYTIDQAVGRCKVDFTDKLLKKDIDTVTVYATLLERVAKYDNEKLKNYLNYYKDLKDTMKNLNLDDYLNEDEKEALLDDIDYIEDYIESE